MFDVLNPFKSLVFWLFKLIDDNCEEVGWFSPGARWFVAFWMLDKLVDSLIRCHELSIAVQCIVRQMTFESPLYYALFVLVCSNGDFADFDG